MSYSFFQFQRIDLIGQGTIVQNDNGRIDNQSPTRTGQEMPIHNLQFQIGSNSHAAVQVK
jgi:hypothetical protein